MSTSNSELLDAWRHDATATLSPSTVTVNGWFLDRLDRQGPS